MALMFRRAALLLVLATFPLGGAVAADTPTSNPQVQFGGECTEGLAEGQHVATNCAITWTDKDGKVYCFSSESAKKSFLQDPSGNLQKAHEFLCFLFSQAAQQDPLSRLDRRRDAA